MSSILVKFIPDYAFSLCTPHLVNFPHCLSRIITALVGIKGVKLLAFKFQRLGQDLGRVFADQFSLPLLVTSTSRPHPPPGQIKTYQVGENKIR